MAGRVTRQGSYITTKKSRRLEIIAVLCAIIVGIVVTLVIITVHRRTVSVSDRCGPKYPLFSVLLKDGSEDEDGGYVTKDLTYPSGTFWRQNGSVFGCPCAVKPCIRKCCPPDHDFQPNSIDCVRSNTSYFEPLQHQVYSKPSNSQAVEDLVPVAVEDDHFSILYGDACGKNGQFLREPDQYVEDSTYLLEDGRLMTMDINHLYLDQSQYCLEAFSGGDVIHTMECFEDQTELVVQKREGWVLFLLASGMIVSIPFFLATFLVYALLPQLQNLHGKSLMCHVMSLMIAYVCLAIVQIGKEAVTMNFCVMLCKYTTKRYNVIVCYDLLFDLVKILEMMDMTDSRNTSFEKISKQITKK
ncbi:hypothetical protein J6590_104220 [Homalodisca vitripennis]|nr:hypothetical protein J6590_104220 [Homalodisca vitripennis]